MLKSAGSGLKVVEATLTQAGWVARFYSGDDQWSLLGAGGVILAGPCFIHSWLPHSGWDGTEMLPDKI